MRLDAIDPSRSSEVSLASVSLLVVSTGFATAADLARTALAVSDAGSQLSGVVLVNPDRADTSLGWTVRHAPVEATGVHVARPVSAPEAATGRIG